MSDASDVTRLLRTPRWIVLTAATVVVIVAFGALSFWQWQRAHRDEVAAAVAADPAPVALDSLAGASTVQAGAYGRLVTVTGTYVRSAQGVLQRGDERWVVTALQPRQGPPLAVVRGSAPGPGLAPDPPEGEVTVVGRLEPYDGDPGAQPGDPTLSSGELPRLTGSVVSQLLARGGVAGEDVTSAWVALTEQTPRSELAVITSASGPEVGAGLRWQNATYAVQWVLFAGFVVFLWWRWFRDDLRDARTERRPVDVAS